MTFTRIVIPLVLALLTLSAILLVQGIRRKKARWLAAGGMVLLLTAAACAVLLEFITRR